MKQLITIFLISALVLCACQDKGYEIIEEEIDDFPEGQDMEESSDPADDMPENSTEQNETIEDTEDSSDDGTDETQDDGSDSADDQDDDSDSSEDQELTAELDNFILDTTCTGKVTVAGKATGDVKGLEFYIGDEDRYRVYITYNEGTQFFNGEREDIGDEGGTYELTAILSDDSEIVLEEGTYNITACIAILKASIVDGAENLSIEPEVTIDFTENVDKDSVEDALDIEYNYDTIWTNNQLKITAEEKLDYETEYEIIVRDSASDKDGNTLDEDYSLTFWTMEPPAPVVTDFDVTKVSDDNETPVRYLIDLDVDDPDDNTPLEFRWKIDCGYFYDEGSDQGAEYSGDDEEIEWRFADVDTCTHTTDLEVRITNSANAETIKEIEPLDE